VGNNVAIRNHVVQDHLNALNETTALIDGVDRYLIPAAEQVDVYTTSPVNPWAGKTDAIRANVSDRFPSILVNYGLMTATATVEGFKFQAHTRLPVFYSPAIPKWVLALSESKGTTEKFKLLALPLPSS
jgi:hypothetical protein